MTEAEKAAKVQALESEIYRAMEQAATWQKKAQELEQQLPILRAIVPDA